MEYFFKSFRLIPYLYIGYFFEIICLQNISFTLKKINSMKVHLRFHRNVQPFENNNFGENNVS